MQTGWLMRIYGTFLAILGMTAYGVVSWRAGGLGPWRWVPAANAVALALWLALEVLWIPTLPERTAYRELMTAASSVPYALTWILLGLAIRGEPRGGAVPAA